MKRFATTPLLLILAIVMIAGLLTSTSVTKANDVEEAFDMNLGMTPSPERGLEIILTEPMGTAVMKVADVKRLWNAWEPEEKVKAADASEEERRAMTWERYGWADRPDGDRWIPLGYTPDDKGNLVTNCFSCHGGHIEGKTIPGMGNTHFDLTTLSTDIRKLGVVDMGRDPSNVPDTMAPFKTPLNHHKGVSNAVIFAPVFAALRNPELAREYTADPSKLHHHDMNAPAWWNFSKKEKIYCDAFAPKTPRQLMPFAMSPIFSDEKFQSFEPNFVHIKAYIDNLEAPKYPHAIDTALAEKGRKAFNQNCKKCHGRYDNKASFPNKVVALDKIGTDPVRFTSISLERREATNAGWLQYDGEHPVDLVSKGYLAQPLDGIWASAPYLHNGSVPTLYHLFNVDERPAVWKRDDFGYDTERVGLLIEEFEAVPEGLSTRERRMHYDTSVVGSSAAGHPFPDEELTKEEKIAVIEYLKTL